MSADGGAGLSATDMMPIMARDDTLEEAVRLLYYSQRDEK